MLAAVLGPGATAVSTTPSPCGAYILHLSLSVMHGLVCTGVCVCVCVCPSNCGSVEGSDLVGASSRAGMSPGAGLGTPGRVGAACPNPGSYVDIVLEQGSCG